MQRRVNAFTSHLLHLATILTLCSKTSGATAPKSQQIPTLWSHSIRQNLNLCAWVSS